MEAIKSKYVLVVEDDENSYLYLLFALEDANYKVVRANDGLEAIQIFTNTNIDGYQACEAIRKVDPSIAIIAQTASYLPQIEQKLKDYQFNSVIVKPYTVTMLFDVIEETLSLKKSKVCMIS